MPAQSMPAPQQEHIQPKIIAFHLPQFHQIPENDEWWGEGFTEWTNVRRVKPLYRGHQQPRIPLDQRFYDLTDPSAREWQAQLAKQYSVDGFCYYHYWFKGKKLLESPLEAILASEEPDFPYCLSWANESWTRAWDGGTRDLLIKQDYGTEEDWWHHFEYLLPFFKDRRYLTYQKKPMFLVYRPEDFPDIDRMFSCWQRWAQQAGLPGISFIKTLTAFDDQPGGWEYAASASFEPWLTVYCRTTLLRRIKMLAVRKARTLIGSNKACNVIPFEEIWENMVARPYAKGEFRGAFVGWDNSPRMGNRAKIVPGATPEGFGHFFREQLQAAASEGCPFVFVNAWNEWAEGAILEPDEAHGHAYLEQLRNAVNMVKEAWQRHTSSL